MKKLAIIGAGIVGLATAYKLKKKYPNINLSIIEKEAGVSKHQTGHNSGVIHSGIYYQPGSLKAKNCINGYRQLLDFCDTNHIAYDICGKLIVATDKKELPILENIYKNGIKNGLADIKKLSSDEILEYEPHVKGIQGILVPQTGIIDYKQVSKKLYDILKNQDVNFYFNEKVIDLEQKQNISIITEKTTYQADLVINCAGLYSDKIANRTTKAGYKIVPFRGEYYKLKAEKSFLIKNLVYPVPNPEFPFLGVHFTRKMTGGIEAGPNAVLAFGRESYRKNQINWSELFETLTYTGFLKVAKKYWQTGSYEMYRSFSKSAFTKALQRLVPEIKKDDLETGGSGIRAQAIDKKGNLIDDFLILKDKNIIHVGNAPSPAATASLSIADYLVEQIIWK